MHCYWHKSGFFQRIGARCLHGTIRFGTAQRLWCGAWAVCSHNLVRDTCTQLSSIVVSEHEQKVLDISIENIVITSKQLSRALAQAAVKATELEMSRVRHTNMHNVAVFS